jgi:2,3-bisphosphoglycerate-independent phosphoglycerate mutase
MGYRAVVVLRGDGLSDQLSESDPQKTGRKPIPIEALSPDAEKSARVVNELLRITADVIKNEPAANYILMRGFSKIPHLESMQDRYGLEPACIAAYPMYRGLASLLGMTILPTEGGWEGEVDTLERSVKAGESAAAQELKSLRDGPGPYTFYYLHFKDLDRLGEDGNFAGKVEWIEKLDALIPRIRKLGFDVIVLTGDHSTPAVLKGHSWHPNPFLLWSRYVRSDGIAEFTERACSRGTLGRMPSTAVMPLVLANALRLKKYGA